MDTEYRPIESPVSHRVVAQQSIDWLAANAQFPPNAQEIYYFHHYWKTAIRLQSRSFACPLIDFN